MTPAPSRPGSFNARERQQLAAALGRGEPPVCPYCALALVERPVPPDPRVSYVRQRLLLLCPNCRRSASIDRTP